MSKPRGQSFKIHFGISFSLDETTMSFEQEKKTVHVHKSDCLQVFHENYVFTSFGCFFELSNWRCHSLFKRRREIHGLVAIQRVSDISVVVMNEDHWNLEFKHVYFIPVDCDLETCFLANYKKTLPKITHAPTPLATVSRLTFETLNVHVNASSTIKQYLQKMFTVRHFDFDCSPLPDCSPRPPSVKGQDDMQSMVYEDVLDLSQYDDAERLAVEHAANADEFAFISFD